MWVNMYLSVYDTELIRSSVWEERKFKYQKKIHSIYRYVCVENSFKIIAKLQKSFKLNFSYTTLIEYHATKADWLLRFIYHLLACLNTFLQFPST